MDRRELLGVLGVGGLVAMRASQARADHEGPNDDPIKTLGECAVRLFQKDANEMVRVPYDQIARF